MTDELVLGRTAGRLSLRLLKGDPWNQALDLTNTQTGNPEPWPAPPVLEFLGVTWTATLSNGDATATWNQTETEVAAVLELASTTVRLSVNGITWWQGSFNRYA